MGFVWLVVLFLIWAVSTIKTENKNIEYFQKIGDEDRAQKSAEHGAIAIVYLGIFGALCLAALIGCAG